MEETGERRTIRRALNIRMAKAREAHELVKLLRKQHGDLHPNRKYYDEMYIADAIRDGRLAFVICETPSGDCVGMICADAESEFAGCLLFCLLTVLPAYRGHALGDHMQRFLNEALDDTKYDCLYAHCLTLDTVSQNTKKRYGYHPTGLLLNRYYFDRRAENVAGLELTLRRSHLVMCKPMAKRDAGMIYPPAEVRDAVYGVYDALGVAYALPGQMPDAPEKSAARVREYARHRYLELFIQGTGDDIEKIIRRYFSPDMLAGGWSFTAFVDMRRAGCARAYDILKERGFFYTGLQPLTGEGEYMILHNSRDAGRTMDALALIPDFDAPMIRRLCEEREETHAQH